MNAIEQAIEDEIKRRLGKAMTSGPSLVDKLVVMGSVLPDYTSIHAAIAASVAESADRVNEIRYARESALKLAIAPDFRTDEILLRAGKFADFIIKGASDDA